MKDFININHAYNGILYAPLFLASQLNLFPANMRLCYRGGDVKAIDSLVNRYENCENWFAICDPFSKDISRVLSGIGEKDEVVIVGALIKSLPMWIYSRNPLIEAVGTEEEFRRYREEIRGIRCYRQHNTGYLIGQRLKQIIDLNDREIIEYDFGKEFDPGIDQIDLGHLVVTSDILQIVEKQNHIVFSYPQRCDDLRPFLFTAVLTLRSVIDEHLHSVLAVLGGLRRAIEILSAERIDDIYISKIIEHLEKDTDSYLHQIPDSDENRKKRVIRESIQTLNSEEIYPTEIDVELLKDAYNNAKNAWEKYYPEKKDIPDIEACNDPIPSLLVKKRWTTVSSRELAQIIINKIDIDDKLLEIFIEKLEKNKLLERKLFQKLLQKRIFSRKKILFRLLQITTLGFLVLGFYALIKILFMSKGMELKITFFFCFILQLTFSFRQYTKRKDPEGFFQEYGLILAVYAIEAGIFFIN